MNNTRIYKNKYQEYILAENIHKLNSEGKNAYQKSFSQYTYRQNAVQSLTKNGKLNA